ncbi:MAG: TetR/AcrR family transcriptional regulator [Gemmatimonadaceae bacterium]|nr:TetR/AcrR family transcriptional regulator [Gemmatimonadaceae bacterium]
MVSRERILEAAGRVYAKHGFRGATTRLIATEAGVNEVTLFRTFGSKGALLEAVLEQQHEQGNAPSLPVDPVDPFVELTAFVAASLERVRLMRPLLVHTMGELDQRPEAAEFACRGRHDVHDTITTYIRRLQARGLAAADTDVDVAAVMLTALVMSDAMARHFVPDVYPPLDEAAERYVRSFLRVLGATAPDDAPPARAAFSPTPSSQ